MSSATLEAEGLPGPPDSRGIESEESGSPLFYTRHSSTDEMLDMELTVPCLNSRVRELERLVEDQQDVISMLRSTVNDLHRRLEHMETSRTSPKKAVGRSSSTSVTKIPLQRVSNGSHMTSPMSTGRTSGTPSAGKSSRAPLVAVRSAPPKNKPTKTDSWRPETHHESSGSLHSDGRSSTSASPATSPSPTQYKQRHLSSAASHLAKRWSSSADFQQPRQKPGGLAAPASVKRSLSSTNSNAGLRLNTTKPGTGDMSYNAEEGTLKIFLKGRPINLYAPSDVMEDYDVNNTLPAPNQQLKLQWAYGYRGKDCRNNLYLLPTGEMIYFVAGVVVLYNIEDQTQRHYTAHTDDVKCLAIHPNRTTIATGQCTGTKSNAQAQVHVWDGASLNTLHVLGVDELDRGVSCLGFSQTDGGALLAIVDDGQDRMLTVWDWQGESKLAENKAATETVVDVQWHPLDEGSLMTCGRQHVNFWQLDGGALSRRQGLFGGRERPKYVTCMTFTDAGDFITGDSDGRILLWERGGNQVARTIKDAHEGTIFTLLVDKTGNIASGGKDGKIVEWDRDLSPTDNVIEVPSEFGSPRMISSGRGGQLLVGTTGNCILTAEWGADPEPVQRGHTDEVWAAAVRPSTPQFATAGWDGRLILWDLVSHAPVWTQVFEEGVQSLAFSSDGGRLAVGFVTGKWQVLDADSHETIFSREDGDEPIQVVQFSPEGNQLALGSRNNAIYIYEPSDDGYNRVARCTGHSSFITHLDWSADGESLRSNSGDYELLYWTAATGRQLTQASEMRDTEWATHTCTLTFNSVGIYPEAADGTDVNTCCRSHGSDLMAAGDDWGRVKLFPYPANQAKTKNHVASGHSSHVTHVEFAVEDDRLLSTGGRDMAVLQWAVE